MEKVKGAWYATEKEFPSIAVGNPNGLTIEVTIPKGLIKKMKEKSQMVMVGNKRHYKVVDLRSIISKYRG